jgi:hypothetical protein
VLVSDGEQTVDAAPGKTLLETAVDAAALVKGDGATVFAWGFGDKVSSATLEQIATDSSKVILAQGHEHGPHVRRALRACPDAPPHRRALRACLAVGKLE